MRARNPCVLARLRTLGCHVRFGIFLFLNSGYDDRRFRPIGDKKRGKAGRPPPYSRRLEIIQLIQQNRQKIKVHSIVCADPVGRQALSSNFKFGVA